MPASAAARFLATLVAMVSPLAAAHANSGQPAPAPLTAYWYSGIPDGGGTPPALNGPLANVFCTTTLTEIQFADRTALGNFLGSRCASVPASALQGYSIGLRLIGNIFAPTAGTYTFSGRADDGNRFWINSTLVRTAWFDQIGSFTFTANLVAGANPVQFDYYANSHGGSEFILNLPNGVSIVPEPSTYALLATGLVGLAAVRRRRRSS